MTTTYYLGCLPFDANEEEIKALVSPFGEIEYFRLYRDQNTDKSRGFAVVTMGSHSPLDSLNKTRFKNRTLHVEAVNTLS